MLCDRGGVEGKDEGVSGGTKCGSVGGFGREYGVSRGHELRHPRPRNPPRHPRNQAPPRANRRHASPLPHQLRHLLRLHHRPLHLLHAIPLLLRAQEDQVHLPGIRQVRHLPAHRGIVHSLPDDRAASRTDVVVAPPAVHLGVRDQRHCGGGAVSDVEAQGAVLASHVPRHGVELRGVRAGHDRGVADGGVLDGGGGRGCVHRRSSFLCQEYKHGSFNLAHVCPGRLVIPLAVCILVCCNSKRGAGWILK
mmetsp:Transcript_2423/g.3552  ORF Transcript_2423/g.3552 Transcript_2423/m.3552 type:complete len:250 (+) Transcript_2423:106-855(+)